MSSAVYEKLINEKIASSSVPLLTKSNMPEEP